MACCINLFIGSILLEISCTHHYALVLPLQKTYFYKEKEMRSVQNYKWYIFYKILDESETEWEGER